MPTGLLILNKHRENLVKHDSLAFSAREREPMADWADGSSVDGRSADGVSADGDSADGISADDSCNGGSANGGSAALRAQSPWQIYSGCRCRG